VKSREGFMGQVTWRGAIVCFLSANDTVSEEDGGFVVTCGMMRPLENRILLPWMPSLQV